MGSVDRCRLLEAVWSFTMKLSEGVSKLGHSAITIVAMRAAVDLDDSARPGIGAVGAFVVGIVALGEVSA